MSRLTRDGTAEPVSRDQILKHVRGQGNLDFPCSADHEQDWQPYPVDPYSAICDDHTYIHTYCNVLPHCTIRSDGAIDRSKNKVGGFGGGGGGGSQQDPLRSLLHFRCFRQTDRGCQDVPASSRHARFRQYRQIL